MFDFGSEAYLLGAIFSCAFGCLLKLTRIQQLVSEMARELYRDGGDGAEEHREGRYDGGYPPRVR